MDSSPQKMSRRKALATMAGAVGLAALPGVGHALNPIKKERRDIQTSAFTSIHTMRNAVSLMIISGAVASSVHSALRILALTPQGS